MLEKDLQQLEQGVTDTESMQTLRALRPWQDLCYTRTDMGNAQLFADFFGSRARYMDQQKCWYVFDGQAWRQDPLGLRVRALAKGLTVLLTHYCAEITDLDTQNLFLKQLQRWQSLKGRTEVIRDAQDVYPLTPDMMDANPMYLNCQNGTLDLQTGALHPHDARDFITRMCGAAYSGEAQSDRWNAFVHQIMSRGSGQLSLRHEEETKQKSAWLQRALGYALTGDTRLECLFMLYGATTRNGKGTLMETFLRLMGDYGATMRPESLGMQSLRTGSAPSEDLARLSGVRFVNISEPDEHLQLSASLVKTLTGRDTVTARFLHQNSFEYRPQFKLFINTNHLPQVTDHTLFDSGRVQLLPFERHFEPQEQDRGLKAELARPWLLSCALKWCFDGLRALREDGFSLGETPDCARRALLRYRADSDQVGQFARECLLPREGGAVKASQVYAAYGDWCSQNGLQRESAIAFHRQLERWYRMTRGRLDGSNTTKIFTGCELVENHEYS